MGLASGYPIGAKITGNLRREKLCTQVEGERLIAFCNTADPLFVIGAVAPVTL
jgi:nucleoside recognition membrane protein YjiH